MSRRRSFLPLLSLRGWLFALLGGGWAAAIAHLFHRSL